MSSVSKFLFGVAVVLAARPVGWVPAQAEYPDKPITLVSPYGPGGAADLAARTVASTASTYLGQPLLVVNKTGAAGVTGSFYVVRSKPNGYTLLLARVGSQAGVPAINPNIPYKWDQFTMLGLLERNPFVLVVNGKSDIKTFADFEKSAEGRQVSCLTARPVSAPCCISRPWSWLTAWASIQSNSSTFPTKVAARPARRSSAVMSTSCGRTCPASSARSNPVSCVPLAVTTDKRVDSIKDVPTVGELKYPKMETIIGWSAIYGPPKLPEAGCRPSGLIRPRPAEDQQSLD